MDHNNSKQNSVTPIIFGSNGRDQRWSSQSSLSLKMSSVSHEHSYINSSVDMNSGLNVFKEDSSSQDINSHNQKNSASMDNCTGYYEPEMFHHQKQSSYAQSEGYHSYVSSCDTSATPFLDRLRQDRELLSNSSCSLQNSEFINNNPSGNESSESISSTETLKWLGSMSDISIGSQSVDTSNILGPITSNLIAHSSRVRTPKRHNSESVLFIANNQNESKSRDSNIGLKSPAHTESELSKNSRNNHRLFPINTYTEIPQHTSSDHQMSRAVNHDWQSVAERINKIERQQAMQNPNKSQKYTYLDPSKTHRVSNPTLKAFQKNAVQLYFERQQNNKKTSLPNKTTPPIPSVPTARPSSIHETDSMNATRSMLGDSSFDLNSEYSLNSELNHSSVMIRNKNSSRNLSFTPGCASNRHSFSFQTSSSSSDSSKLRNENSRKSDTSIPSHKNMMNPNQLSGTPPPPPPRKDRPMIPLRRTSSASDYAFRNQNTPPKHSLSQDLLGPIIMGRTISVDDWVPERPPKNPLLRIPSPELPPPPALNIGIEVNLMNQDEPLPPPPPELLNHFSKLMETPKKDLNLNITCRRNSFAGSTNKKQSPTFGNHSTPVTPNDAVTPPFFQSPLPANPKKSQTFKDMNAVLNRPIKPSIEPAKDIRMSLRKRLHNSLAVTDVPQPSIMSPPPLKPRMPKNEETMRNLNRSLRFNAKTSDLPKSFPQNSKLTDRNYKLKIDGRNENGGHNHMKDFQEILPSKNNLPDVLPIEVKLQRNKQSNMATRISPSLPLRASIVSSRQVENKHIRGPISPNQKFPSSMDWKNSDIIESAINDIQNLNLSNYANGDNNAYIAAVNHKTENNQLANVALNDNLNNNNDLINQEIFKKPINDNTQEAFIKTSVKPLTKLQQLQGEQELLNKKIENISQLQSKLLCSQTELLTSPLETTVPNSKCFKTGKIVQIKNPILPTKDVTEPMQFEQENLNDSAESKIEKPNIFSSSTSECDGLKLIQRTEIVLRVNAPTSEASSQTDEDTLILNSLELDRRCDKETNEASENHEETKDDEQIHSNNEEEISMQFVNHDNKNSDMLSDVISEKDVFSDEETIKPSECIVESPISNKVETFPNMRREITLYNDDDSEFVNKKEELIARLSKKLTILSEEQTAINEESIANDLLGNDVTIRVAEKVKPTDVTKFRSYVDDMGHITLLTLTLTSRLEQIENNLHNVNDSVDEKLMEMKRQRLLEQLEEAKKLKIDIDRRGVIIAKILEKHLNIEEYADYNHFITMKTKLLIDSREIAEKIKLGEEQLNALRATLVHSDC